MFDGEVSVPTAAVPSLSPEGAEEWACPTPSLPLRFPLAEGQKVVSRGPAQRRPRMLVATHSIDPEGVAHGIRHVLHRRRRAIPLATRSSNTVDGSGTTSSATENEPRLSYHC